MVSHSLVIGYHGCDLRVARKIIALKTKLKPSQNAWDWLGHGRYFWEDSPERAKRWAQEESRRKGSKIKIPGVLGAVIALGNCLNLADAEALKQVKVAHDAYLRMCAQTGAPIAQNRGAGLRARYLDCMVMETLTNFARQKAIGPSILFADFSWRDGNCIPGLDSASWIIFKSASASPNKSSVALRFVIS